ncbi:MAG: flippase-like domain-containing protein [Chloroflexi bacterium]|nr:flippase-like domain-containing protein [Chloroflexota bacterium]MCL5273897.1 flippase-like domain-containing protein [Chloroflexota bacterium]
MINNWRFWLGLTISAIALYFTLRGIHFDEFAVTLSKAQVIWLLPAFLMLMTTLMLRAWRWSSLMGGTPFWVTFHANNIGYLLNSTLPFRLGEIGRAYVIGERTSVRMTRALSTVVVERVLDLASIVLMFVVFAQFIPMPPQFAAAAMTGAIVVAAVMLGFVVAVWQSRRVETFLLHFTRYMPRLNGETLVRRFRDLVEGFDSLRSPARLALALGQTAGVWTATLVLAYFTMMAFMPARLDEMGLTIVLANLGGALPSAPGGLGVVQFFAKQALVIPFQVPEDIAVAFAFVWSLFQQLALIVLGIYGLFRVGMSFSSVSTSTQQNQLPEAQITVRE